MLTWTFLPLDFEVGRHRDLISGRWSHILCGSDSRPVFTVCILPEGIVIPYFVNKMAVLCLGVALETVSSYISLSAHCEEPCSPPFVTHLPNPSYVFTWSHTVHDYHGLIRLNGLYFPLLCLNCTRIQSHHTVLKIWKPYFHFQQSVKMYFLHNVLTGGYHTWIYFVHADVQEAMSCYHCARRVLFHFLHFLRSVKQSEEGE